MDSPCIAMNEPPKFGENQVPKRASRSSRGYGIPWETHSDREMCLVQHPWWGWDGDGMGAAWQSHKAELGDSSGLCPAVLRFYCFIPDGLGMAQQTPDRLC